MFVAHAKRTTVERLIVEKNAMISGLWGNSNLDDGENSREKMLREIDANFQMQVELVYSERRPQDEIDIKTHPLFTAMKMDGPHPS